MILDDGDGNLAAVVLVIDETFLRLELDFANKPAAVGGQGRDEDEFAARRDTVSVKEGRKKSGEQRTRRRSGRRTPRGEGQRAGGVAGRQDHRAGQAPPEGCWYFCSHRRHGCWSLGQARAVRAGFRLRCERRRMTVLLRRVEQDGQRWRL